VAEPTQHTNRAPGSVDALLAASASARAEGHDLVGPLADELRRALTTLAVAVDAGGLGVWRWDSDTGTVSWSERMEKIYGFEPGQAPRTFASYLECIHPDDRQAAAANFRDRSRGLLPLKYLYRIIRQDGEVRWLEGAGQPLLDDDGRPVGAAGACMDVTERVLSTQYDNAEVAITRLLAESADDPDVLDRLIELLGFTLPVEVVSLWTPAATGSLSLRHAWSAGPSRVVLATRHLSPHDELALARRASLARAPVVVSDLSQEHNLRRREAALADELQWAAAFPIIVADEVEGVLECFGATPGPAPELCETLGTICSQTGLFLGRARALEVMATTLRERARVAEVLQQSLLPPTLPSVPGIEVAARYAAGTELVGGDFYDVFPLGDDRWGIAIGDVCGKGPEAARLTALLRHSIRTAAMLDADPAHVLSVANTALLHGDADGRFASAVYGSLTAQPEVTIRLAGAGHPPAVVVRTDGTVEELAPSGRLLGLFDEIATTETAVSLGAGDAVVLYTDGIIEARRVRELFGTTRLTATLADHAGEPADTIADALMQAVEAFSESTERDDQALLVLRVR
jgi:sigma-B regulation protein RsbU (phosphoserine phosphatase)